LYQTAPIWRVSCGLEELEVTDVTEIQVLPESSQFFAARIALQYRYLDRWMLSSVEPRLAGVAVSVKP
jgi:hypothetical protein